MNGNRVLPPEQRASWARERTIYDNPPGAARPAVEAKPIAKRTIYVGVEIDDTDAALERVCRALTNADAKIVKVVE